MGVRMVGVVVVAALLGGDARAGVANLDNGQTGTGHMKVSPDEYGAYGFLLAAQSQDQYEPAGENINTATLLTGLYVTLVTPDLKKSIVALSDLPKLAKFVQGSIGAPAIAGTHTGLVRANPIFSSITATDAKSTFQVGSSTNNPVINLEFTLDQAVTHDAPTNTTDLVQTYVIKNTGASSLDLKITAVWDADLIWRLGFAHNVAGAGPGLCYVYVRDSSGEDQAVSLADGGSTVPLTGYYGSRAGFLPSDQGAPAYDPKTPSVFTNFGIPTSWIHDIARIGYNLAGESPEVPSGDADIGLEWKFTLAVGASETIAVRRVYGTYHLLCSGGVNCGNGVTDAGEACDPGTVDSATCNAISCTAPSCGDGHVNTAAGEECESSGVDNATCVGTTCKTSVCGDQHINTAAGEICDDGGDSATCTQECKPSTCGDGYVNTVAGEECEAGELCDPASCTFDFELGGGCVGCNAKKPDASWILLLGVVLVWTRRRRSFHA